MRETVFERGIGDPQKRGWPKLVLQSPNGFVFATLVIESACVPSTYDL